MDSWCASLASRAAWMRPRIVFDNFDLGTSGPATPAGRNALKPPVDPGPPAKRPPRRPSHAGWALIASTVDRRMQRSATWKSWKSWPRFSASRSSWASVRWCCSSVVCAKPPAISGRAWRGDCGASQLQFHRHTQLFRWRGLQQHGCHTVRGLSLSPKPVLQLAGPLYGQLFGLSSELPLLNSPGPASYFDGTIFSSSSATSFVDCPMATIVPRRQSGFTILTTHRLGTCRRAEDRFAFWKSCPDRAPAPEVAISEGASCLRRPDSVSDAAQPLHFRSPPRSPCRAGRGGIRGRRRSLRRFVASEAPPR
jgi:hypothetical protein